MRRALAFILLGLLLPVAAAAAPLKIRIAWVQMPSELQPILFAHPGLARHLGESYEMEPVHFAGTPAMIAALAAGELDIVPFAFSSLAAAIENARMDDIRIIADEFQDGAPGHYTNAYMVLKESPIARVEDLKGKIVASNAIGSALDMGLRVMLRTHGLEDRRDYTLVEANFANMKAMLLDRKVDLICAVPPFSHDPALLAAARPLFTQRDALGHTQMTMWTARRGYIEEHHAALVDFLEDYLRALRWITAPENQDEVVRLLAAATKLPPEHFAGWVYTAEDQYRDPAGLPDLEALQASLKTQYDLGFIKQPLDIAPYVDLTLIKEAGARLK